MFEFRAASRRFCAALVFCLLVIAADAGTTFKQPVTFTHTQDVGFNHSVFVVGNHPDVGNWDVTQAIKLRHTPGNVWTGEIAIEAGVQLQYRFISRNNTNGSWCSAAGVTYLTPDLFRTIPSQPAAPYRGKTIYYLSGWNPPSILYLSNGAPIVVPMTRAGDGRSPTEFLYKISGLGEEGEDIEFVFTDGQGNYDNPPGGGNYLTKLDVFQVQDGNVYSYQPPLTVSAPQTIPHTVGTGDSSIPRTIMVYLPRGYTQNTTRRYPVLYLHDGQNCFDPATAFGGREWQADETATREIGQGRMRETIMVAIYNNGNRLNEYRPPGDNYNGQDGVGDDYANFVINNVRPYVDNAFRTLNDPKNTLVLGSSLGGLISLYMGREFTTFGKVGVFSPAFWIADNYVAQVNAGVKKPLRVYLDFGTSEPADDWQNALAMYDTHLAQGYAANADVTFVGGCGQAHDELAWRARLPAALRYLLPATEAPNELAQREFPPRLVVTEFDLPERSIEFSYASLYGFSYTFQRSSNFVDWSNLATTPPATLPWTNVTLGEDDFPAGDRFFWRLQAVPAP